MLISADQSPLGVFSWLKHFLLATANDAEFRTLFEKAGFRREKIVPTPAEVSVLEARPV